MTEISRETFDGRDFFTGGISDALDARSDCFAIQMDRARAALRHAATILGSGQRVPLRLALMFRQLNAEKNPRSSQRNAENNLK
jgi:hypothetical protein